MEFNHSKQWALFELLAGRAWKFSTGLIRKLFIQPLAALVNACEIGKSVDFYLWISIALTLRDEP